MIICIVCFPKDAKEEKSVFFPFRDGKEINRHEFIRLHQENPSY